MLYAERDQDGKIVAVRKKTGDDDHSEAISEQELFEFLLEGDKEATYESLLRLTDTRIIRVLDDLIDVLIKKNVIMLTDLPDEAREKIGARRETRKRMNEGTRFTVDDIL